MGGVEEQGPQAVQSQSLGRRIQIGNAGVANKTGGYSKRSRCRCEVKSYELSDLKGYFLNSSAALLTYNRHRMRVWAATGTSHRWSSSVYVIVAVSGSPPPTRRHPRSSHEKGLATKRHKKHIKVSSKALKDPIRTFKFTVMCFLCLFVANLFGAEVREEDDVADRGLVGQKHHQAIDADADARGGRHAVRSARM